MRCFFSIGTMLTLMRHNIALYVLCQSRYLFKVLTVESRIRSQVNPCGVFGGQITAGRCFLFSSELFQPIPNHCTISPYSFVCNSYTDNRLKIGRKSTVTKCSPIQMEGVFPTGRSWKMKLKMGGFRCRNLQVRNLNAANVNSDSIPHPLKKRFPKFTSRIARESVGTFL